MKPAEGTILTVSRLAAAAAVEAANAGASLENALVCAIKAGDEALENTVNMNPVLKKAGVIDAGGMGYMIILKAMLASLRGEVTAPEEGGDFSAFAESSAFDVFDTEDITFAFDTVFIVRKKTPDVDLEPLRKYLSSIGDSLVIGDDDEAFKVHVHTNIPGNALNEAQKYGTLELAKIENMRTQHEDLARRPRAPTIWNRSRRSWRSRRTPLPSRRRNSAWSPSAPERVWRLFSGSLGPTVSSPADRP